MFRQFGLNAVNQSASLRVIIFVHQPDSRHRNAPTTGVGFITANLVVIQNLAYRVGFFFGNLMQVKQQFGHQSSSSTMTSFLRLGRWVMVIPAAITSTTSANR